MASVKVQQTHFCLPHYADMLVSDSRTIYVHCLAYYLDQSELELTFSPLFDVIQHHSYLLMDSVKVHQTHFCLPHYPDMLVSEFRTICVHCLAYYLNQSKVKLRILTLFLLSDSVTTFDATRESPTGNVLFTALSGHASFWISYHLRKVFGLLPRPI